MSRKLAGVRSTSWALIALVAVMATFPNAYADDVEDAIKEALAAYKKQEFSAAAESLDYATTLIRQRKGSALENVFPTPLDGWKAEQASSQAAGTAFFGGGVTAERTYKKGDRNVTVSLVTDSPMLQGVMMMFGNPMFMASDGGKMKKIAGQKAMVKYPAGSGSGEITIAVAKTLVTVRGQADEAELIAYAERINFAALNTQ